ncbi:MAG: DUF2333 family protein [Deltaproteobacteria bacterium]|jgi:hypothetical protein|nr:DUF2333 family protein [Deltaproteobacteria bacterium]
MAEEPQNGPVKSHWKKISLVGAGVLVFLFMVIFIANYRFPSFFDPPSPPNNQNIPGWVFTTTIIDLGDQMFSNWLPNDIIWPTAFMDNRPNYQLGELKALTYTVLSLKENLSRLRSSDAMDNNCSEAYSLLNNDPLKWIFPSAESRFEKAIVYLQDYRQKLEANQARFSPRADNLSELLRYYVSLLGTLNAALANAPGGLRLKQVSRLTPPPPAPAPANVTAINATNATAPSPPAAPLELEKATPYSEVDDHFYEAQGAAYVLREMMAAIRVDFREILEVKKATEIVDDIILTLDQSQFEPIIVLNGDIGSITANHSMELHSILENSRQKINNLMEMISQ